MTSLLRSAKIFSEAYDAREEYRGKSEMPYWNITDAKIRDLVLLEVRISRFRLKSEDEQKGQSSTKYKSFASRWETWRAQYEIHAISLLKVDDTVVTKEIDADVHI